jgi:starvation-inducible outer membrane lipoprotein
VREGKIDEMEYVFPVFEIRQIHLWEEQRDYWPYAYPYSYYYYPGWYPWCYNSWGRSYPCSPYGYPPYW